MTEHEGMRAYYERRAREYDDWWHGTGRFAERDRPGWHEEVEQLIAALQSLRPATTLDVACGTGFLTRHLPGAVTAIDQSATMVEVARERLGPGTEVLQGDALALPFHDGAFERVHTGHFYGHLLGEERDRFLAEARRVSRELVITDSAYEGGTSRAGPTAVHGDGVIEEWQTRVLDDGSEHRVYKRWFTPEALNAEVRGGTTVHAGRWFVVVAAGPTL